jgi:colanic acid biosynthesis glycosyl transferase WcaI
MLPLQPHERLPELLGLADIHMLPQRTGAGDMVMPSKLTGMLASARPVIAMADAGTELAEVVKSCGVVCAPGDLEAFAQALTYLHGQPRLREELGLAGRAYACANLSADGVLRGLEKELRSLVDGVDCVNEFQ